MASRGRINFLTNEFYNNYRGNQYKEILRKRDRPYITFRVKIDGIEFALPFRSDISHSYAFFTNEDKTAGIDYSKAVVITESSYIDIQTQVFLRQDEFEIVKVNYYNIEQGFKKYLKEYKKAAKRMNIKRNRDFCKFSALQYFHNELGI